MSSPVLQSLIAFRVDELFDEMPGVRDGDAESIHRARVASRRLRELLPLTGESHATAEARRVVRAAGRQLGRVRDLDIMTGLLARYEDAMPSATAALAFARQEVRRQRCAAVRELVKALERLDLAHLRVLQPSRLDRVLPFHRAGISFGAWMRLLRERIERRADKASAAVDHSAGLYFPNRLHRTRIALKKLRYAIEIAAAVRAAVPAHIIHDLTTMQSRLGDIHDLHVLSMQVGELAGDQAPASQLAIIRSVLGTDIARLHRRYLKRRDRMHAAIEAARRVAVRPVVRIGPLVALSAVSAVALPAALMLAAARTGNDIPAERTCERR